MIASKWNWGCHGWFHWIQRWIFTEIKDEFYPDIYQRLILKRGYYIQRENTALNSIQHSAIRGVVWFCPSKSNLPRQDPIMFFLNEYFEPEIVIKLLW